MGWGCWGRWWRSVRRGCRVRVDVGEGLSFKVLVGYFFAHAWVGVRYVYVWVMSCVHFRLWVKVTKQIIHILN
jgi:hypothetical protein